MRPYVIELYDKTGKAVFQHSISKLYDYKDVGNYREQVTEKMEKLDSLNDDRALAILGFIIIDNQVDDMLTALLPDYSSNEIRSFLMKIQILKMAQIIPNIILDAADKLRIVRNRFAHQYDYSS